MYNFSYLQDSDFLHEFDRDRNKEQLIKITILDWKNESPLEEITGSVIDGNISIDGSSAMRRTANISLLLNDYDYNLEDINNIISINKKVEIMIGFVNNTNKYTNYPVLWFPQGIYLIISASITHDSNGIKASLTLHDKMALLNGECGGIIPAATVFNEIENEDDYGNISKEYPTIVQIIQQLVNHFGNEQLGKIIIKDLQPIVKQVLKWNSESNNQLLIYQDSNDVKVQTLYYNIYKSIYYKVFDINDEEGFNKIFYGEDTVPEKTIPTLQDLILNLQKLKDIVEKSDNAMKEEESKIIEIKNLLEKKKFSLISDVKKQLESFRNDLDFIQSKGQESLQGLTSKNSYNLNMFKNGFTRKQMSQVNKYQINSNYAYISDPASIFDIKNLNKLYSTAIELRKKLYNVQQFTSSNWDAFMYLLFNLDFNGNNNNELVNFCTYDSSQFSSFSASENSYKFTRFPTLNNFTVWQYYDFNGNKIELNNQPPPSTTFPEVNLRIYFTLNSCKLKAILVKENKALGMTLNYDEFKKTNSYTSNSNFFSNNKNIFVDFIELFKYFRGSPLYSNLLLINMKYIAFYIVQTICNYYGFSSHQGTYQYGVRNASRTKVITGYLIDFVELIIQQLSNLISIKNNILIDAKQVKKNLLDFSLLKNKLKSGKKAPKNILQNKESFTVFIEQETKKLKNLIDTLPIKKSQENNTNSILYRQEAQTEYQNLEKQIITMKEKIRDLEFSTSHEVFPNIVITDNLLTLSQPFALCFEPVFEKLDEMLDEESIFNKYSDTTLENKIHGIIKSSLQTIQKNIQTIDKYKKNFSDKSLIKLQQWINTSTFNQTNFSLPIQLKNLAEISFQEINDNDIKMKNDELILSKNLLLKQTINTQTLNSNYQMLNKIIKKLPNSIEAVINYDDLEGLSLLEQINMYIIKLQEIIQEQDSFGYTNINKLIDKKYYKNFFDQVKKIQIFEAGEDIGYTLTDFTYPGSLTAAAGETVISVLDKIKNTLGNYQYFYDINGNFIFQQIRNYLNKSYSTYLLQENSSPNYNYNNTNGKYIYSFNDGEIIQSYSNSINYQDIKNDFVIWGERKTADGKKYPIRYHLAIDTKPATSSIYCIPIEGKIKNYLSVSDFPNQGEKDFYYYALQENTFYKWIPSGGTNKQQNNEYGDSSFFGYKKQPEKIKKCIPIPENNFKENIYYYNSTGKNIQIFKNNDFSSFNYPYFFSNDYRTELYLDGITKEDSGLSSNDYYIELKNEWPKLFNFSQGTYYSFVKKNPDNIDYYLDLLSTSNLTSQYGISLIGKRTQIITNNNINCIFQPTCPNYVFNISKEKEDINKMINKNQSKTDQDKEKDELLSKRTKVNNYFNQWNAKNLLSQFSKKIDVKYDIYKNFANGGTARSAYEEIRSVLYQYLTYNEQISLTTIPIYYLQPNNLIQVSDAKSNINGSYLVKSISLPLGGNGTMTMNCSKAIEKV